MPRHAYGGRPTCEGCKSLDIRRLAREKLLQPGRRFSLNWSANGHPTGNILVEVQDDAILLVYQTCGSGAPDWKDIRQRVPITWTNCALGGSRPWFVCSVSSNGRFCGRRVAILYAAGDLFACRLCYGLAYASQSESPCDRYRSRAQKIRMRLGGSPNLLEPFPEKPRGMHWRTYNSLRATSLTAEIRSVAIMQGYLEQLRRRSRVVYKSSPRYRRR
jgi:hypothetical protein